jgi:galactokinase
MNRELPTPPDFAAHINSLRRLRSHRNAYLRELFDPNEPIYVARAPGRLDVMGGIADYSGSLVLQLPIREAAFAAVQLIREPGVVVVTRGESAAKLRRVEFSGSQWQILLGSGYNTIRDELRKTPITAWAAYVLGPVVVLLRETSARLEGGLRILIDSRVPEGKGVSSSAALEVATMRAAAARAGKELDGPQLAQLCQKAENLIVGAPCGIMDQMTSALGRENGLLALRCQPAMVEGYVPIPDGIAFWGIDSGIRHAVSGSDYTSVRVGAFMGYRMIADAAGLKVVAAEGDSRQVHVDDPVWNGYLANVTPAEFRERFLSIVPEEMTGREFLKRYTGTTDGVTRVDPVRVYAVRRPTLHPIEENVRAHRFRELLQGRADNRSLTEMGQLMYASHDSYSACRLGSDGTDLLVQLVRDAGHSGGLFGAKITGGGSGGTVAVLGHADAGEVVSRLAQQYAKITRRPTYVFRGSSPGACATTVERLTC